MHVSRAAALSVSLALLACGDDGGNQRVDSGAGDDVGPKVCATPTAIGATEIDVTAEVKGRSISFEADIGEVNGYPTFLRMEFRHSQTTIVIPSTVDLAASGENRSYATCTTCLVAVSRDPNTGAEVAFYFQDSGTVSLGGDPIVDRHLTMTVSNVTLQAATFDSGTGDFTKDPAGECVTLNGSVDDDNVPNEWTCTAADYYADNDCHCGCGPYDPDCRVAAATTVGCSGGTPVCVPSATATMCVAEVDNDTCASATALSAGTSASPNQMPGTTVGAKHHYDRGLEGAGCTGSAKPGPDVVYSSVLVQNTAYTISLTGLTHDGGVAILGPAATPGTCTDMIATCLAGKDANGPGGIESFVFTPPSTGEYYIIVDSREPDGAGAFTLSITGP